MITRKVLISFILFLPTFKIYSQVVENADRIYELGYFERSSSIYYSWLSENLESPSYLDILQKATESDPQIERAIEVLQEHLKLNKNSRNRQKIVFILASLYESKEDYENARKYYMNSYLYSGMKDGDSLYKASLMLFYLEDYAKAKDYVEIALKKKLEIKSKIKANILKSNILYYNNMKEEAISNLEKCLQEFEDKKDLLLNLYFLEEDAEKKSMYYTKMEDTYKDTIQFEIVKEAREKKIDRYSIEFFPAMYTSTFF